MGASSSKVAGQAAATAARRLPTAPTAHIPPAGAAPGEAARAAEAAAQAARAAEAQQAATRASPLLDPAAAAAAAAAEEKSKDRMIIETFHRMNAAVDKRAIPAAGYSPDNPMLHIIKKRRESSMFSELPERVRAEARQESGELKTTIDTMYRMLRGRHAPVRGGEAGPWTPEAGARALGWDPAAPGAADAVRAIVKFVNVAEPMLQSGGVSQRSVGKWVEAARRP